MNFILKHKIILLGVLAGAIGGFIYYSTIGCTSGSCAITSQPVNSTLYGAMLGGLTFSLFQRDKTKDEA